MDSIHKNNMLIDKRVSLILILTDLSALLVSYAIAFLMMFVLGDSAAEPSQLFFFFICPIVIYACLRKGHYTRREPWWSQVRFVFFTCLTALFIDVSVRFLFEMPLSHYLVSAGWVFGFFLILLGRQIACFILKKLGLWDIDTILIGTIDTVVDLLFAFSNDYYTGYNVKSILLRDRQDREFDMSLIPSRYKDVEIIRDSQNYIDLITEHKENYFVVCLDTFRGDDRDKLIKQLGELNVLYSVVPPTASMRLFEMRPQNFFGYDIMLLQSRNVSANLIGKCVKRLMDIVLAFGAMIALSPVFLAVAICQKREGQGGTLFYGGKRVGKNGELFKCWKFRSMEPDTDHLFQELLASDAQIKEDWDKFQKLKVPDPRVQTKTSRIMRKTSIDELPQLWNVIIGDMSLVGPRPILESEKELMKESYNNYIKVRPGISGLWQVSGRNDTSFERRIYMDNWYVRNQSIWGDITIMFKTIMVVLKGSGM